MVDFKITSPSMSFNSKVVSIDLWKLINLLHLYSCPSHIYDSVPNPTVIFKASLENGILFRALKMKTVCLAVISYEMECSSLNSQEESGVFQRNQFGKILSYRCGRIKKCAWKNHVSVLLLTSILPNSSTLLSDIKHIL